MKNRINKFVLTLVIAFLFLMPQLGGIEGVQAQEPILPVLQPYLSADGLTLYNGVPPLIVIADPNLAMQGIQVPASPEIQAAMADPEATNATFSITYVAAGGQDLWGAVCQTFPDQAKTAFNAAAAIWASTIQSSVPITISACWSNLGSSSILGYSGGEPLHRNFTGAPKSNTWYEGSLANALNGSDLDAAHFDDYITYNSNFTWYYGTDGHPTSGTYDLVTVAAHEIAHGLNFAGMADYSGGVGSYDYLGYPSIYDTFMEDGSGTKLTSYTNNSTSLGSLLTSGNLWFNGTNANAANGGSRVRIYAPSSWSSGSSYSHLDYSTFAGTINSMMVYAVASGASQHNPGPVTKGIFKDMGWTLVEAPVSAPAAFNKSAPANTSTQFSNATLSWQSSTGATSYYYCIDTNPGTTCDTSWVTTNASTSVSLSGLSLGTHYWQVYAHNSIGDTYANSGTWWSFTVISAQKIYLPLIIKSPPPPGSFGKSSPTNGATGQSTSPTLSWGTSSGTDRYEYCIGTSACNSGSTWTSTNLNTSVVLGGLSTNTTYYWQVRAVNAGGNTYADNGTGWSFTTAPAGASWTTIMTENFEGSFPGSWHLYNNRGYDWGKRNCRVYAGSYSGWGVGGGTSGSSLGCGSNYPLSSVSWMVYGPFSLTGATAADFTSQLWVYSESEYDWACLMASTDGDNFYGNCYWGNWGPWFTGGIDLSNVYTIGNLLGNSNVWVALEFYSDSTINYAEGAYADNIILRKCTAASCTSGSSISSSNIMIGVPASARIPKK
jgi:hypothetical protein